MSTTSTPPLPLPLPLPLPNPLVHLTKRQFQQSLPFQTLVQLAQFQWLARLSGEPLPLSLLTSPPISRLRKLRANLSGSRLLRNTILSNLQSKGDSTSS